MAISGKVNTQLQRSSWIRRMFEEGAMLKQQYGVNNVFDFTLGNPNVPPPEEFNEALVQLITHPPSGIHRYTQNAGDPATRDHLAQILSAEYGVGFGRDQIIMTCGAAGGLNVVLKSILDEGDEVIILSPYFVEYLFYVDNHGGRCVRVDTKKDFTIDVGAIADAITPSTKALILNSPNNPTGAVYPEEILAELGRLLREKSATLGKAIYLISDEPYRRIIYDGVTCPSIFPLYPETLVVRSFSKELGLAGERIGYIAIGPEVEQRDQVFGAAAFCNRILGYVNAPALMQHVLQDMPDTSVDIEPYRRNRDLLYDGLLKMGYGLEAKPQGAFYIFPRVPMEDDVQFVQALREERVLAVPGIGFGRSGYIRISYCVDEGTVIRGLEGLEKVLRRYLR